ncbi:hypothetical protein Tco_0047174 [Tanacetum coccineum]
MDIDKPSMELYVDCGNDVWRMQGSLGVSRAIGDKHLGRRDTNQMEEPKERPNEPEMSDNNVAYSPRQQVEKDIAESLYQVLSFYESGKIQEINKCKKASAKRLDDNNAQATSQVTVVPCVDRYDKPHAKRTHRQTSNEIQKNSRPDISVIDTDVTQESTGPQCTDHDPQAVPNYSYCFRAIINDGTTTTSLTYLTALKPTPSNKIAMRYLMSCQTQTCQLPSTLKNLEEVQSSDYAGDVSIRKLYHFGMANVLSCLLQAQHHMISMRVY